MKIIILAVFSLFLVSCTFDIKVNVGLDFDDPCLTCFPSCSVDGTSCLQQNGDECTGCQVSCLLASDFQCVNDDPQCVQVAATETLRVPVFCLGPQNFDNL